MEWLQALSIIATVIGSAYYIHREIQIDMKNFREEIKAQSLRSDRLYEIWCQTQKDIQDSRNENMQRWADLLKEKK